MTEQPQGVKEEASQALTTSPVVETEQSLPTGQPEAPQEGVTSKDDIATNLQKALKEEREKRRAAEAKAKEYEAMREQPYVAPQQYAAPQYSEPFEPQVPAETDRLNKLSYKLATDPTFKERLVDVEEVLNNNPYMTVEQADDTVLASVMRNLMAQSEDKKELKNLNQQATPEPQAREPISLAKVARGKQSSGNPYFDKAMKQVGW